MTSNFIPYLPSSPPPLDDNDDDDDEFGSFSIANHLCHRKVDESTDLKTTEKRSLAPPTQEELKTENLHIDSNDYRSGSQCVKSSEYLTNDEVINHIDDLGCVSQSNEDDLNSAATENLDVKTSLDVPLADQFSDIESNAKEVNCNNSIIDEDGAHEAIGRNICNDDEIPETLVSNRDPDISSEYTGIQNLRSSSAETDTHVVAQILNTSDDVLEDCVEVKTGCEKTNVDSDDFDDEFGNFVAISADSAFQLTDCVIDDKTSVANEEFISTKNVSDNLTNSKFSDTERVDVVKDESANSEQWDGFVSGPQTNALVDDADDEFSDFVCPPSDDSFQIPQHSTNDTWPSRTDADDENVTSFENCSRRDSAETFHPNFEAHFSDSVSQQDTNLSVTYNLENVSLLVSSSFPKCSTLETEEFDNLDSLKDVTEETSDINYNVWPYVSDIEKMNALSYQWRNSSCSKKFLKAINIDSRNLLFGHNWNSSVPLFAANLSLNPLEPTKTPLKSTDASEVKELILPQPQEVLPPAQFDWNGSGLINPLDASNGISALLDLDFFFTNENGSINAVPSATWSLENELLGTDASDEDNVCKQINSRVSPLLEQILSSAKLSASNFKKVKEPTAHSSEAQIVLNKLPDLSFMQAKVLMFPIRNSSP